MVEKIDTTLRKLWEIEVVNKEEPFMSLRVEL